MRELRCIIVDDEPLAVKMLENFVSKTPGIELMASFTDSVQAFSEITAKHPDVVFLDIQMPDLNGMELSRMIPQESRIIFTTAFKQYAFESYEVSALDFLLKPINYQKFLEAVQKARRWFEMKEAAAAQPAAADAPESGTIYLKADKALQKVSLSDILYVEGMKDYVLVYLAGKSQPLVTHTTMKAMEDLLPASMFMRVHRSYIVSLKRIDAVCPGNDLQIGTALIHVSDAYREAFEAHLASKSLR